MLDQNHNHNQTVHDDLLKDERLSPFVRQVLALLQVARDAVNDGVNRVLILPDKTAERFTVAA